MPKYMLCFALVADGQTEEAREILNELEEFAENGYMKPYFVAMAYAALGEIDAAFEWFEKAVKERDEWMIWFGTDPKLDALRKDTRYLDILAETNNPIICTANPSNGRSTNDRKNGKINRRFAVQIFECGAIRAIRRRIFEHRSGRRSDDAAFKCAAFSRASDEFGFAFRRTRNRPVCRGTRTRC